MNLTVNFRNNTTRFIKINGIDTVIKPNDEIEDITYQWFTSENKTIDLFSTIDCQEPKICSGSLTFVENDGCFFDRGNLGGVQSIKTQVDIEDTNIVKIQEVDNGGEKICEWSELTSDTVINVSYFKI